ncbi:MAG: ABC transporter substrate-binding protein, partial [Anaerolineales bacterium]|nr:ABC transporter substrate-binding protein [Anaerolineales bacterium]
MLHAQKRLFVIMAILLMLVSACGTPAPTEAPVVEAPVATEAPATEAALEPVTFQVFYPVAVDAPIAKILNGYIEAFQAEYPHITVEPVFSGGYADVQTAIQTTIDGGGEPPALTVLLATSMYDLINADYIAPMDGYIASMENGDAYLDDFLPAFMANSRYEDQVWSIPFQRSAVVLYYNVDMFKEAGLEPPTSWESWATAAQTLTVANGDATNWGLHFSSDWPYWLFQPLAIGNGQNIFVDECHVAFNDPKVIEAVQYYIDLSATYKAMPAGVQATWPTDPTDFASGATAMIAHTTGSLTSILSQATFEVGVMPYPGKEEGTFASVSGGGNFYILKGAPQEQQDAAWKFIEFVTSPELAADFSIQTGYIASRTSAYETDAMKAYVATVPQALQARDALQYAEGELAIQDLGEVRGIFHSYIQKAFNGEMS